MPLSLSLDWPVHSSFSLFSVSFDSQSRRWKEDYFLFFRFLLKIISILDVILILKKDDIFIFYWINLLFVCN
jgi:hypothetical protein